MCLLVTVVPLLCAGAEAGLDLAELRITEPTSLNTEGMAVESDTDEARAAGAVVSRGPRRRTGAVPSRVLDPRKDRKKQGQYLVLSRSFSTSAQSITCLLIRQSIIRSLSQSIMSIIPKVNHSVSLTFVS